MNHRDTTREISIGNVKIGGGNRIAIQSMTNTDTADIQATVAQILRLEESGCDIIRCTANTKEAAMAFNKIKEKVHIPVVADIHFDYRLAIQSIEYGADKIRINPGNIGGEDRLKKVVEAAKAKDIPIRVGVNSGSLEREILMKYGGITAEGIVESAMDKVSMIEKCNYDNIVISIKSSNVMMSVASYDLITQMTKYPLHVGITEAGTVHRGNIKSAVGLGIILNKGIGDTIRVSLTCDPVEEIVSARTILTSLGMMNDGIELVSCPTCGRTKINIIELANRVEKIIDNYKHLNIKVAVMGCVVNGPGEARDADLGVAGGEGVGILFKKGVVYKTLPEEQLLPALKEELDNWEMSND